MSLGGTSHRSTEGILQNVEVDKLGEASVWTRTLTHLAPLRYSGGKGPLHSPHLPKCSDYFAVVITHHPTPQSIEHPITA